MNFIVNPTKCLSGHLTIFFIFLTQINFLHSIFFVRVDRSLFYKNLEESMLSRFLNTNTRLRRNTTLREKNHTSICDKHIFIWYSNNTVSNPDREMCTIEMNNISSWYCSNCIFPWLYQATQLHDKYQTCVGENASLIFVM